MKVLRVSMYSPDLEPVTVVMREEDLIVPIEEAEAEHRIMPGGFIVSEIFEDDGTQIEEAAFQAVHRQTSRSEREINMATLYYYDAEALKMVSPGGVMSAIRAPLNVQEIETTLVQLAQHPNYDHQTVLCVSEDGQLILMRDGECEIKDLDDEWPHG